MILMIDDVKMVNADMFYPYVSKALAHDMDSIATATSFMRSSVKSKNRLK